MGHWCRRCGRVLSNERFSGKGHRTHVCKECTKLPVEQQKLVEDEAEIISYLSQSNISKKNKKKLKKLAVTENRNIAELASLILEIGLIHPYKRRRMQFLAEERRDLLERLEKAGIIFSD
jgi:hypothetical protein